MKEIRTRDRLIAFLKRMRKYVDIHALGYITYKEIPHGQMTDVVVTVYGVERRELASVLFANRHAVLHIRDPRFGKDTHLKKEAILRIGQACKLIELHYHKARTDRIKMLRTANTFSPPKAEPA